MKAIRLELPGVSDWTLLLDCPKTGSVKTDGSVWRFRKHGSGIMFISESDSAKVDLHSHLNQPTYFDKWRLESFLNSRGRQEAKARLAMELSDLESSGFICSVGDDHFKVDVGHELLGTDTTRHGKRTKTWSASKSTATQTARKRLRKCSPMKNSQNDHIKKAIINKYCSLESPNFSFQSNSQDERPYRAFVDDLLTHVFLKDCTNANQDVSFVYEIRGDVHLWMLQAGCSLGSF